MHSLLLIGLANVVVAAALAVIVLLVSRICRRPALVHGLWVLVLLKLLSPPLVPLPVLPEPSRPVTEVPAPVEPDPSPEPQVARFEWADEAVEPPSHVPDMVLEAPSSVEAQSEPVRLAATTSAAESMTVTDAIASSPVRTEETAGPAPTSWNWGKLVPIAFWMWAGGSVVWLLWTAWALLRFGRMLRCAIPAP